ncbi:hypothetical protein B0H13DRAFT_2357035 [Mycena leptocephala]|nr:hypothetical protein B0H13DRAFT_2357035 [Mycena leptocephala]
MLRGVFSPTGSTAGPPKWNKLIEPFLWLTVVPARALLGAPPQTRPTVFKPPLSPSQTYLPQNVRERYVTGNIAILSLDGRYMKVTASNGLAFGDQTLDDRAKFSSTKKYVNMYYIMCEGLVVSGLSMGILHLTNGMINFTIQGYQGQDGRTHSCPTRPAMPPTTDPLR